MYVKQSKTLKNIRGQVGKADKEGHLYKNYGGVSGALNDDNDPWQIRRDKHAEKYYEALRNREQKKYDYYHIEAFGGGCEVSV